jgi:hypothetical protein
MGHRTIVSWTARFLAFVLPRYVAGAPEEFEK